MKAFKNIRRSVAIGSLLLVPALEAVSRADSTVVVTPSNMNGWALNSFDDNGNIVTSGPFLGTAALVTGIATPPLGVGSAHLETPAPSAAPDPSSPGAGGAEAINTDAYDTTPLSAITSLSYWAYMANNGPVNGQQFPYLAITINTGAVDTTGNGNTNSLDTLFFEPPYQQPSTGNPNLPNQGPSNLNQWQVWNAYVGGFWDNGFGTEANPENVGTPGSGVEPLLAFKAAYPDATIAAGDLPGLGGIAMQVGFADSTSQFDGYVDDFTIGIGGVNTTYDFEPASVPEPASAGLLLVGSAAALMRRRRRCPA